jgi:hypothetical protein
MQRRIASIITATLSSNVAVFALIAVVHGVYVVHAGPLTSPDASTYNRWSDAFVRSEFGVVASVTSGMFLRTLFIAYLACMRIVFGGHWMWAFALLNLGWDALTGMLVVAASRWLSDSAAAPGAALMAFLLCYGLIQWTPFILSDTLFTALVSATLVATMAVLNGRRGGIVAGGMIAMLATVFARPPGIIVPAIVICAILGRRLSLAASWRRLIACVAGVIVAVFVIAAFFLEKPSRWPLRFGSVALRTGARQFGKGQVIYGRYGTFHRPPETLLGYVAISADRFVRFFQFVVSGYSGWHNLANIVFFVPLYVLAMIGILAIPRMPPPAAAAMIVAATAVVIFATFHAVTQIDFDWRYRAPVVPQMILLAAGGAAVVARRISEFGK